MLTPNLEKPAAPQLTPLHFYLAIQRAKQEGFDGLAQALIDLYHAIYSR